MKKETALVVMAAGLGSRYGGGIKQLSKIDETGHIIMDYSIHDALKAGFNRIIFVIRHDIEKAFMESIGNRMEKICRENGAEVYYAYQELWKIPFDLPEGRTKPWGTGHAVLCAKEFLDIPFAIINADDYYGKAAFRHIHDWLIEDHADHELSMAGFLLKNTLSENGGVTRGICEVKGNSLTKICETKNIVKTEGGAKADRRDLNPFSFVSMNLWGCMPGFVDSLEKGFQEFKTHEKDPLTSEYLLPIWIGELLEKDEIHVKVLPTSDRWFGITYAEDLHKVFEHFGEMIQKEIYQRDLFADLAEVI